MLKKNEGYTLAYVVIVLAVIASVAMATMSLALIPQKNQHLAQERMQEKYAAQGYVEQAVAQLEHEILPLNKVVFTNYITSAEVKYVATTDTIIVTAKEGSTTITATLQLEPVYGEVTAKPVSPKGDPSSENQEPAPVPEEAKTITGYTVTYLSFTTTVEKEVDAP